MTLKQRFEILQRDGFRCRYCGRKPSEDENVILQVDHIIPKSKGGEDNEDNLITSCRECNMGKMIDDIEQPYIWATSYNMIDFAMTMVRDAKKESQFD